MTLFWQYGLPMTLLGWVVGYTTGYATGWYLARARYRKAPRRDLGKLFDANPDWKDHVAPPPDYDVTAGGVKILTTCPECGVAAGPTLRKGEDGVHLCRNGHRFVVADATRPKVTEYVEPAYRDWPGPEGGTP